MGHEQETAQENNANVMVTIDKADDLSVIMIACPMFSPGGCAKALPPSLEPGLSGFCLWHQQDEGNEEEKCQRWGDQKGDAQPTAGTIVPGSYRYYRAYLTFFFVQVDEREGVDTDGPPLRFAPGARIALWRRWNRKREDEGDQVRTENVESIFPLFRRWFIIEPVEANKSRPAKDSPAYDVAG